MTDTFTFETATKGQAKARIALTGPSGAGKTWTGLILATTLGHRVAVIDTERGSASKYAGEFAFDRLNMQRYDPRDLPKALAAAAAAGYDAVLIDSLSKFWAGEGGMLQQVDNAARRSYGGNSFGGWKEARPMESAMIEAILSYPGHIIVTLRTRTAYEIIEDNRGKKVPTKIGLKPEQRDGIEYEFDIVGDMDLENTLTVSKSRCSALSGEVIRRPGPPLAETILAWLSDGVAVLNATEYRQQALRKGITFAELRALWRQVRDAGLTGAAVADPDGGEAMSLGQLLTNLGKAAEARETFGADDAAPEDVNESPSKVAEPDPPRAPPTPVEAGGRTSNAEAGSVAPAAAASPWVTDFRARLAEATEDRLMALQREIGSAIAKRTITAQAGGELSDEIRARRRELDGVPA